jgi:hypothetical protein
VYARRGYPLYPLGLLEAEQHSFFRYFHDCRFISCYT